MVGTKPMSSARAARAFFTGTISVAQDILYD